MNEYEAKPLEEMSFREGMAELDRVVAAIESNQLELEESLQAYERGVQLITNLEGRLTQAEQKVTMLMGQMDAPADDATTDTTLS